MRVDANVVLHVHSWTLLATTGGSYAPGTLHPFLLIMPTCDLANLLNAIHNPEYQNPCLMSFLCSHIASMYKLYKPTP